MVGSSGTREISKRYPITSGLGADQKHKGRQISLIAEKGSLVARREKAGL